MIAAILATATALCLAVSAIVGGSTEVDFRLPPPRPLVYEVITERDGSIEGVSRTRGGGEQRLKQTSEYRLDYVDEIHDVRDGRVTTLDREFVRAETLTTLEYGGDRAPELEQRAQPFEATAFRFRRKSAGDFTVTFAPDPENPGAEPEPVGPELERLGRIVRIRDPHLPLRSATVGHVWSWPAVRVMRSVAYGPTAASQAITGTLTIRFARIEPAFGVDYETDRQTEEGAWIREPRPERCAVLIARGEWTTTSRSGATIRTQIERTLHYSLEHRIVVATSARGTWRIAGTKNDLFALDHRGAFSESTAVVILEPR